MTRLEHLIDGPVDAPVLVLGNSVGTTIEMWEPQVRALADRVRIVRYEHPGHGDSELPPESPDMGDVAGPVVDLLDELGIERVVYCGVSLGGMVALWLARHAPKRIDRIVVGGSTAGFGTPETWEARAATVRRDGMGAVADMVMERYFSPAFRERRPEVVARFRETLASLESEGYARCCEAIRDWEFHGELTAVRTPTLLLAGEEDAATPPERLEWIAEGLAGARLRRLPGAGHLLNVEQPEAFNAALTGELGLAAPAL